MIAAGHPKKIEIFSNGSFGNLFPFGDVLWYVVPAGNIGRLEGGG
jgi:hypothetical protein